MVSNVVEKTPGTLRVTPRLESLLSSRLFLVPQSVGDRLYFLSNLSGHLSLYGMDWGGSVPEPLIPPDISLQNPELIEGYSFVVFPRLEKILVMIDRDGDENYQPMFIPISGGVPEPIFPELAGQRVFLTECDEETGVCLLATQSHDRPVSTSYRAELTPPRLEKLAEGPYGPFPDGLSPDGRRVAMVEGYAAGDHVLYLWTDGESRLRLLYGKPMSDRQPGENVPFNAIHSCRFTAGGGLLFVCSIFEDTYGLGYLRPETPGEVSPVAVTGLRHNGQGELESLEEVRGDRYRLTYNIDGATWIYEGSFDEDQRALRLDTVLCGEGELSNGVVEGFFYDEADDRYALAFSTATSPTQLYTLDGPDRTLHRHTRERVLGISSDLLAPGEDASFVSHDGLRVSARLYLPSPELEFRAPFPLVYYIHGGPQGQERPNFAWFSMPLIQYLTLNGFAVFVPNVRGSTGYGLDYMNRVHHDWGGQDRLDHVHAMTEVLPRDQRLDTGRAAVVGRSYGGYMTLTLAGRHPELWSAACDMFGPYNLFTFVERVPESWKPYVALTVGNTETERDFVRERSPETYIDRIQCPLLVIQGRNDPRVIEQESRDVVARLQQLGKEAELLVFENEGHDVLKFENKVRCYTAITEFFRRYLHP